MPKMNECSDTVRKRGARHVSTWPMALFWLVAGWRYYFLAAHHPRVRAQHPGNALAGWPVFALGSLQSGPLVSYSLSQPPTAERTEPRGQRRPRRWRAPDAAWNLVPIEL